ncbi:peptidase, partial [Prevotella sp. OH937_COT-195]|uniref:peptidase n=1 Tax=Prevotella sp. OH937_COT-195 TaxID=2491051 RepID=UPI0013154DC1
AGGNEKGIHSQIDNLTVKLTGTNTVTAVYTPVLHTKPMTLTGGGTLNAESTKDCGIYVFKTSLTIDGCTVNAKGKWGIAGNDGSSETLTIRNATVTAEGTDGSICDFKEFTLYRCAITSPAGAVWNAEKKAVCDASGNIIKSKVTIEPVTTYDLVIAGKRVNEVNCDDLSVIEGVSGTVNYDHSTKTLTLDNATINGGYRNGIESHIYNLTVKLIGTNAVMGTTFPAVVNYYNPMTITGNGTLNAESTNNCAILVYKTSLTIDGCTVNAKGKYGITGDSGSSESLALRNATVTAEGTNGSIRYFNTLTLEGCKITSPAGAVWNAGKGAVCDASGNVITDKVTITRDTNGIETVTADVPAGKRGVYNLQGV